MISIFLIYCSNIVKDVEKNCRCIKEDIILCVNPLADFPLPNSVLKKLKMHATDIREPSL